MLGIRHNRTAFFYCITDDQFSTIMVDQKKLTIGNSKGSDICLEKEWIGNELAVVGRSGSGGFYFRSGSDKLIYLNGQYLGNKSIPELKDRDCISIISQDSRNWVILWFRSDTNEAGTKWARLSCSEAAGMLPIHMDQDNKYWYICPQDDAGETLLNKQVLTDTALINVGTTISSGAFRGVFTPDYFYYEVPMIPDTTESPEEAGQNISTGNGTLSIDIKERIVGLFYNRRVILRDIHIDIHSGEMVLILGGSGAGKSTFMNAVIGYEKATGSITYNNRPLDELRKSENAIGFVPQDNVVREGDKVGNAIRNAAQMKLPESILANPDEFNRRIQHTLDIMGLKEKEKSLISKLSGGEKKRVNVAAEYIGDPLLFFLDEPDTGVDPAQDEIMMRSLRSIADEGKIVMMITHTPDRGIDYYDKVIVIAKNKERQCGELAFYGTKEKAWDFFGIQSFEEIIKALNDESEDRSSAYVRKYQSLNPGRKGLQ